MLSELIIISGTSGSGKSVTLNALEDAGYYCIDNLPIKLLEYIEYGLHDSHKKIAINLDARNIRGEDIDVNKTLLKIKSEYENCSLLYLDADDNTLIKRFTETRRRHPLSSSNTSLREAISLEREVLGPIADLADDTINTTTFTKKELQAVIRNKYTASEQGDSNLLVLVQSFGFKNGIPPEADYLFDVRCIDNPYWNLELRPYSGLDPQVQEFLRTQTLATSMCDDICDFLNKWLPNYAKDDRSYVSIAIGCTGGKHRSVFISEQVIKQLKNSEYKTQIRHRDLKAHS